MIPCGIKGKAVTSLNVELGNRINQLETDTQKILQQDLGSTIAQETIIREQVEGGLLSQYTVKIDDNGAVSGFGLASENVDGSVESAFIVRADKFAVVQPTSTSTTLTDTPASASIPFTVDSDGRTIIKSGVIGSASISSANIENLSTTKLTAGVGTASSFSGGKAQFTELYAGGTPTITQDSNGVDQLAVTNPTMHITSSSAIFDVGMFQIKNTNTGVTEPIFQTYFSGVAIREAIIGNATIGFAKIKDDLQSTNYSQGGAGWRIQKNGNAEFNNLTLGGYVPTSGTTNFASGILQAGLIRSSDSKFIIDLNNKSINITT